MVIVPFVDTNWLVAAYFVQKDRRQSDSVARFTSRVDSPWIVSPLVLIEARNAFLRTSRQQNPPEWQALQADLNGKLTLAPCNWPGVLARAEELIGRFSHKALLGSLDVMLAAHALDSGATHFLSFDTGSNLRALAAVLKLKVFPDLTADDKRRMALLR